MPFKEWKQKTIEKTKKITGKLPNISKPKLSNPFRKRQNQDTSDSENHQNQEITRSELQTSTLSRPKQLELQNLKHYHNLGKDIRKEAQQALASTSNDAQQAL